MKSEESLKQSKPVPRERYGGVAQLGEHLPCKQGVMGSNPIISTNEAKASVEQGTKKPKKHNGLIAQVVRARA